MLNERLQILISSEQRRRLEREAKRRGTSVASVIRDAVDAQLRGGSWDERRAALDGIRGLRGRHASVEDLNRLVAQEREEPFGGPVS